MFGTLLNLKPRLLSGLLPRVPPPMGQWAERTIIIPDGPYKGEPFSRDRQPFARLFFAEIESGRWDRIAATGPTQTGKTLICYVIPILYHNHALRETVVAGIPTLDIVQDKWTEDLLPVIEASPELAREIPSRGEGSRGGRVKARIKFRNGATLRFMTGGSRDTGRAGFTARVLAVTEVDGMDEPGATSRETDKISQMEGRLRAHLKTGIREYLECTVTIAQGRIWKEYQAGTRSRIARPCPHCPAWVTPEREHLKGWEAAEDELEARESSHWTCPACEAPWTEAERYQANLRGILVHRGQEVTPEGQVTGPIPRTRTLGFRWTAVDNHFATAADVGAEEWAAKRDPDRENAEKKLRQQVHCIPWDPPDVELTPLDPEGLKNRLPGCKRGEVPLEAIGIGVGIDTGKRILHWLAESITLAGSGQVIEYGTQTVEADRLGVTAGLIQALRLLRAYLDAGWRSSDGRLFLPDQVWIDSRYHEHTEAVYAFCREANADCRPGAERYRPSIGYAEGQRRTQRYMPPKGLSQEIRYLGKEYHLTRSRKAQMLVVHCNADHWKSELHQRLAMPPEEPGAIRLYETADPNEHGELIDHLTAERQTEKWFQGRGELIVWDRIRRQNHFLDAGYAGTAAAHLVMTLHKGKAGRPTQGWFAQQTQKKPLP